MLPSLVDYEKMNQSSHGHGYLDPCNNSCKGYWNKDKKKQEKLNGKGAHASGKGRHTNYREMHWPTQHINSAPVPSPRTNISKLNSADDNSDFIASASQTQNKKGQNFKSPGAQTKEKDSKNGKNNGGKDELPYVCITCEKYIHKGILSTHANSHHHEVLPVQEGIKKLENKVCSKLQYIEQKAQSILGTEHHINEALNSWLNLMMDHLLKGFGYFRESAAKGTRDLLTLVHDIQKVKSSEEHRDFMEFFKFQNCAKEIVSRGENLLIESQQKPFWLITTWFKVSLGLMLHSGTKFCVTSKDHAEYAPLAIQGDRILLSCFRDGLPPHDKETQFFPYDFMKCIFEERDSCAFMRISYANNDEGFVFVRIDGETFWGEQFLSMCTGIDGRSYRGMRVFRNCIHGKPGHHIWAGDYSKGDGSGGEQVIFGRIDTLNAHPQTIVRGLLAARVGYEDRSTIFRVYIKGREALPMSKFEADVLDDGAFGNVEDGLCVLDYVANMPDITKAVIFDVGRVLMLG